MNEPRKSIIGVALLIVALVCFLLESYIAPRFGAGYKELYWVLVASLIVEGLLALLIPGRNK